MPKKTTFWLTMMLSMLLSLLVACGPGPSTGTAPSSRTSASKLPPGENLYVLDGYTSPGTTSTAQQIIAFHPGSPSPNKLLTLPAGLTSMDHRSLYIAASQAGKLVKTIHLDGNFDLDAVNPDGAALYLLQRLNDGSGHYYVELYNVKENELYQNPIVDKTQLDETRMTGTALARQMASDGTMAYTLYIDTFNNKAFVHILPLDPGFPLARCVDLPVGKSADLLHYYTLTLSPDGSTLYAANGALGVAGEINLQAGGTSNIYSDNLVATAHFNPGNASTTSGENMRMLYNGAVLSPDQGTLYFVGMQGIWSVNTLDLHAKRNIFTHYLTQQTFTGIAISQDGRTLYAVDPKHGITVLDARTGQAQGVIQGPAHSPWGIAWITN